MLERAWRGWGAGWPQERGCWPGGPRPVCAASPLSATLRLQERHLRGLAAATLGCWHLEAPGSWTQGPLGARVEPDVLLADMRQQTPAVLQACRRPGKWNHGPASHCAPALGRISKISAGNSGGRAGSCPANSSAPGAWGQVGPQLHAPVGIRGGCVHRPRKQGGDAASVLSGFLLPGLPFLGSPVSWRPLRWMLPRDAGAAGACQGEWLRGARPWGPLSRFFQHQNSPHDPQPTYSPGRAETHMAARNPHPGPRAALCPGGQARCHPAAGDG